jgi:hypothetical protein
VAGAWQGIWSVLKRGVLATLRSPALPTCSSSANSRPGRTFMRHRAWGANMCTDQVAITAYAAPRGSSARAEDRQALVVAETPEIMLPPAGHRLPEIKQRTGAYPSPQNGLAR